MSHASITYYSSIVHSYYMTCHAYAYTKMHYYIIVHYILYITNCVLFIALALRRTQWTTLVTGRYMITMMMLLCYVNLSGMPFECI